MSLQAPGASPNTLTRHRGSVATPGSSERDSRGKAATGQRGVCGGDSGGPLFTELDDGTIVTLGVVHGGDESCLGTDWLTRLDALSDWIVDTTGIDPEPAAANRGLQRNPRAVGRAGAESVR